MLADEFVRNVEHLPPVLANNRVPGDLIAAQGYSIVNVDSTVIIERPKLKDFRHAIREKLAETLTLELGQVSVKFKTAEKTGPVGEGRSAEAQALVTICRQP